MTEVKGYMGSVSFDGRNVTLKKRLRGSTQFPIFAISGITIEPASIGMKAIRFWVAGGSQAPRQTAMGSYKDVVNDPNALTFMLGATSKFKALIDEIDAARFGASQPQAGQQPAGQPADWAPQPHVNGQQTMPTPGWAPPAPQSWAPPQGWAAGSPVAPKPPHPGPSHSDELQRLAELHKSGALTDEEFSAAKARLLGL